MTNIIIESCIYKYILFIPVFSFGTSNFHDFHVFHDFHFKGTGLADNKE